MSPGSANGSSTAKRGVLSPDEIHKLASKTKKAVGGATGEKASCHSDYVDGDQAKLIQVNVAPAFNRSGVGPSS